MRKWEKFLEHFFCFFFKEAREEKIPYATDVKTKEKKLKKADIID